jgi:hypothetical protein
LGRRQTDSLERAGTRRTERLEPLERKEQVRATFGRRDRMDLVDDDRVDAREHATRLGGTRCIRARSVCGVSPVRSVAVGSLISTPVRRATSAIPASGARRFFSMSTASAFSGDT